MVWCGGPSYVVRCAASVIAVAASLTASCGGRSGLFAFDSDAGAPSNAGTGGVVSAGTGGGAGVGTGGFVAGSGGVTSGAGGGSSATGGVASAGAPPMVDTCGDAQLTSGEECDDGNVSSGDGCTSVCRIEPGGTCPESGRPCTFPVCGNGVTEFGEECDAGASNGLFYGDRSGCTKFCLIEPDCRFGACARRCGDGNVDSGESCDDGNRFGADGCGPGCGVEPGFSCEQETVSVAEPCADDEGLCQRVAITYRDFEHWQDGVVGGHPDFFLLGAQRDGKKVSCVPDASGRRVLSNGDCPSNDSTAAGRGFVSEKLGANGRPFIERPALVDCRFTDWTDSGLLSGLGDAEVCVDAAGAQHDVITETVILMDGPDAFAGWFASGDPSTEMRSALELRAGDSGFRFSSGQSVEEELHAIFMGQASTLSSGFFPLETLDGRRVCNLFPYFLPGLASDCSAGPGKSVLHEWDPRGSDTPGVEGTGGFVSPVRGVARNFHFTSEVHVLYRYTGAATITFTGDDDVWVFLNGHLVLDLGGTHTRMRGTVTLDEQWATWAIEVLDPESRAFEISTVPPTRNDIEIEAGRTYDLAIFHANRSPRDSNYELTIDRNDRVTSICVPTCGDGVVTFGEECDFGADNTASGYGGCTTDCHVGPYCGDGVVNAEFGEECEPAPASACSSNCVLQVK